MTARTERSHLAGLWRLGGRGLSPGPPRAPLLAQPGLWELPAGRSSVAMPAGSGEALPSPPCLNRLEKTLLGFISSPFAVITGL